MNLIRLCALVGALFAVAFAPATAAPPDPFLGSWVSTDTDGSSQKLAIGGGPGASHHVQLFDDFATSCGEPFSSATGRGIGEADGDVLSVATFEVKCHNGNTVPVTPVTYTHFLGIHEGAAVARGLAGSALAGYPLRAHRDGRQPLVGRLVGDPRARDRPRLRGVYASAAAGSASRSAGIGAGATGARGTWSTNSRYAIGAESPGRGPILTIRV
jgi:hypothetical protein